MSRLSELIAELCPDEVEYKALGELLDYEQPGKYIVASTDYSDEYSVPVLTAGKGLLLGYTDETEGVYVASDDDPVIIFDDFTTSFHWITYNFKVKSSAMKMLRPTPDCSSCMFRYAYYAMKNIDYAPESHTRQWIGTYSAFRIPVPPLEVQREIVRILDEYTAAHDELVRQLEEHAFCIEQAHAAYLQTAYDEAFRHCERVPLGKHCNLINGDRGKNYPSRGNFVDEGAAFINAGHIQNGVLDFTDMNYITEENYSALRSGKVKSGDILYCLRGSLGKHCLISNVHGAIASSLVIIRCDREYYLPEFINYTLDMPFITDQMNSVSNGSAQPNLAGRSVAGYQVPLPTLKEQRAFVSQLDRHAVGSFNELAAELRLQSHLYNQQLSLVRNQLLSFPEKVA